MPEVQPAPTDDTPDDVAVELLRARLQEEITAIGDARHDRLPELVAMLKDSRDYLCLLSRRRDVLELRTAEDRDRIAAGITINGYQLKVAADLTDDPETELSIGWREAGAIQDDEEPQPSPAGLYASYAEYPEEGVVYLAPKP